MMPYEDSKDLVHHPLQHPFPFQSHIYLAVSCCGRQWAGLGLLLLPQQLQGVEQVWLAPLLPDLLPAERSTALLEVASSCAARA